MNPSEIEFRHESALDLLIRLEADGLFLSSKLRELDSVLSLLPGKCYEIDGDIGMGKTQVCYSLAAQFLETKKSARIGWISAIPLRTDLLSLHFTSTSSENEHHLERIACCHVEKLSELRSSLKKFCETPNLQLVVIENIDSHLHDTVYDKEWGRNVQTEVAERLRKLNRAGITVVVTNHITHWRGFPAPSLGVFWTQQIANRFFIGKRNEESDVRRISTVKEGNEESIAVEFRIGDRGLEAVKEEEK